MRREPGEPWLRRQPLRRDRRAAWLPPVAGAATALVGLMNLASALAPDLRGRIELMEDALHGAVPTMAHALTLPAGTALVLLGFHVARRRRRAWALGVATLAVAGLLNLLKGLDVGEAIACWALAGVLVWTRDAFPVRHEQHRWRPALGRVLITSAAGFAVALLTVLVAAHWGSPRPGFAAALRDVWSPVTLTSGPTRWRDPFDWLPVGIALLWVSTLVGAAYAFFRPLAGPRRLPEEDDRRLAREIVERHGSDTLSFFKLRCDKHYLFDSARQAFLAYRVESGVLLVSGDPVGPAAALGGLVRDLTAFAEARGLAIAVLGASEEFAGLAAGAGLRSLYLGDEAIVDTASFSLDGRAIRKVRQSVTRLDRAGYSADVAVMGELREEAVAELEAVSERWRDGAPERGFSMAMDSLRGDHVADSVVVLARDADGDVRGFLHFVPCYGRPAMSMSLMCRDLGTPNGLTEFMVVRAIELMRERGIEELSLNFAAFARMMHAPAGPFESALGRAVTLANPFFQIESLYRFNAKFGPRWQPRFLLYEKPLGLPRAGMAALWVEGQLPKPRLRIPGGVG